MIHHPFFVSPIWHSYRDTHEKILEQAEYDNFSE
jgi:hypothetical protein